MQKPILQLPRRAKRRRKRHTESGQVPGTIVTHAEAPSTRLKVVWYTAKTCEQRSIVSSTMLDSVVGEMRSHEGGVLWIDVAGYQDVGLIRQIGDHFGLHPLALEDAVNSHQRPKVDFYGDHLFVVARIHLPGSMESEQVAFFLGRDFVITFQEREFDCLGVVRNRVEAGQGRIRNLGADYLLYALLDAVIDSYFPILEQYGERLDALDDQVTSKTEQWLVNEIHGVRTELLSIRRTVWPLRETINSLIRDSGSLISDETDLYLRDCYDHTVQIIDVIETDRELCADLRDFYLSVVSNRMNQVMKFLTIIATLFMPLSFIAGLYGMNFNTNVSPWNMPELNWTVGYPFALGLMSIMAGALMIFFWRKGWLS